MSYLSSFGAMALLWCCCLSLVALAVAVDFPKIAMEMGTPASNKAEVPSITEYDASMKDLDIESVMADLEHIMTESQDWWPADYGHYGPFFIRLAWHCSGTFRDSDGMGGCGGGRQRFEPERSWDDNVNLDKARALVWPIKDKYQDALSWGDLFVLAGTAAIKSMGGPIEPPCVGRIDAPSGAESLVLGPSEEQDHVAPCEVNGHCETPLGTTTVGLIYMNPEGRVEKDENGKLVPNPDPNISAAIVRDVFGRMGFNVEETLALIGGGHTFGKSHGACAAGTGPPPHWPGYCGTGVGNDTFSSGIEGAWTTRPTKWDNEFWQVLTEHADRWEKHKGPGGHWQWRIKDATGELAMLMRMTTDVALLHDEEFKNLAESWAKDSEPFDKAFAKAWFKLTHDGGRWSSNRKCLGDTPYAYWMLDDDLSVGHSPVSSKTTFSFVVGAAIGILGSMAAFVLVRRLGTRNVEREDAESLVHSSSE